MDSLTLYVSALALPLGLLVLRTVYHLYFHPLSSFPGPKLAAATFLYEFYYDVVKSGMYIWEIERMHEKYGKYIDLRSTSTIQGFQASKNIQECKK